jgi:hypothetical protein
MRGPYREVKAVGCSAPASTRDGSLAARPIDDAAMSDVNNQNHLPGPVLQSADQANVANAQFPVTLQRAGIRQKPRPRVVEIAQV